MSKYDDLVTSTSKPKSSIKKGDRYTFAGFRKADEEQKKLAREERHRIEIEKLAKETSALKAIEDAEKRITEEQNRIKRNNFVTDKLTNAFGTKKTVVIEQEEVNNKLNKAFIPTKEFSEPFEEEPALNRELSEFKKKIHEHIAQLGLAHSSGGGAGFMIDLDDVQTSTAKVDGKFLKYSSSDSKWVGADAGGSAVADDISAGDAAVNITTTSGNITIDAAANNTDIIFKGTDATADITMLTLDGSEAGAATFNDKIVATELDISGNVDVDGTLEADAYTVDGTTLAEYISDTTGAMVSSNTETGITVTYQDSDNTIDFAIDAAQTAITSIYNSSLAIGYGSSHANIDFGTDNRIVFDIDGTSQVLVLDGVFRPTTDSDVDLGASAKYWKDAYIDTITTTGLVTAGGRLITDDATEATSTTDGSLQTDGGLSVVKDAVFGDDLLLLSDSAVIKFGADQDVTLTHVHNTGILLNSTMAIQFNDASQYINAPSNAILDINATDEIELNATLVDINANVEISGTATTTGVHTFTAVPVFPNNTVETADIQADAITGAKIADDAIDSEHYAAGSIDTAHIADDQITLAKMASGTDGNVISYDASGNPVAIATGTDGQVLTSTGAGSPPAFEDAAGGGAWVKIATVDASDDATLDITGLDSTYDTYEMRFSALIPATDGADAWIRFGDSSGFDSASGDYHFSHHRLEDDGSANYSNSTSATEIRIGLEIGSTSGEGFQGGVTLHRPGDASSYPTISIATSYLAFGNQQLAGFLGIASRDAAITLDRVQFLFSSGNVASGRFTIWGISHA